MGKKERRKEVKGKHEGLVDLVERRLRERGTYALIKKHEFYSRGEMDVMAMGPNRLRYYEVKSNYNKASLRHAKDQARRFYEHFGTRLGNNFIYVAYRSDGSLHVERMRPVI